MRWIEEPINAEFARFYSDNWLRGSSWTQPAYHRCELNAAGHVQNANKFFLHFGHLALVLDQTVLAASRRLGLEMRPYGVRKKFQAFANTRGFLYVAGSGVDRNIACQESRSLRFDRK